MAREHKVFISHAWAHHDELESLRRLIDARPYFNAEYSEVSRNEPINSTNAPYIKSVLKRKILDSNILIGYFKKINALFSRKLPFVNCQSSIC